MLKSSSQIRESPRKIEVQSLLIETEALTAESSKGYYEVKDPISISDKSMQDVVFSVQDVFIDKSSSARVALWEDNVGIMQQGRSYTLKNFVVRVFQSHNGR